MTKTKLWIVIEHPTTGEPKAVEREIEVGKLIARVVPCRETRYRSQLTLAELHRIYSPTEAEAVAQYLQQKREAVRCARAKYERLQKEFIAAHKAFTSP